MSPEDPPTILARGWTRPGGRPHAEAVALEQAGEAARGATLYVTLEPCTHHGKSPPCTDAIIAAGIKRVVCGILDPDPRVAGTGIEKLAAADIEVVLGVMAQSVCAVTAGHLSRVERERPRITLKTAVGADGLVPQGEGSPVWVTGELARNHAHLLRARHDAILVGSGTVKADDPSLTCRLPGMADRSPVRVVLDSGLSIPPAARMLGTHCADAPVWIICGTDASEARENLLREQGALVIRIERGQDGLLDVREVCRILAQRGITSLLVEGGPRVAASFLAAGDVDEIALYQGAVSTGPSGLRPFVSAGLEAVTCADSAFAEVSSRSLDADIFRLFRIKQI
ncbi:MAG: bifunctional diaminohydroxyphosphoribosylaminopyrimidine deaminase/5-amino-6-(5-phosphoribosylamino)uracil reductase RibD [Alphaproteobacteria bacterium]|nr:MAG: bifunctional diaminohydroxyphosphoribosylaminopyrimidine deaminase/5-amino-6-(5-phosphoribosylamino)uracil reductase RibD [Alphaproteobacteria bacterium]